MGISGSGWMARTNVGSIQNILKLPVIRCRFPSPIQTLQNYRLRPTTRLHPGQVQPAEAITWTSRGRPFPSARANMKMRTCISTLWKSGVAKPDRSSLRRWVRILLLLWFPTMSRDVQNLPMEVCGCRKNTVSQGQLKFRGHLILYSSSLSIYTNKHRKHLERFRTPLKR